MKVGILTFHDGPNHGAFLQAYSTMKFVEGLGHDVKIINYKNKLHHFQENWKPLLKPRRPSRYIDFFVKKRTFRKAHRQYFSLTKFTKSPQDLQKLDFDVVIVGSDVVWNYKIFGFDDVFYGNIRSKRLISYAASFGWVNYDEDIIEESAIGLKRFEQISVRDENSSKIVEKITGVAPPIVLDPTLIYNFENENEPIRNSPPFILVYSYLKTDSIINQIKSLAQKENLITISLGYRQDWCDKVMMDVGPFEWIGLIKHAKYMVTSTFHGAIFAIKYQKHFFYITNEKAKNRVKSLFETCKLEYDLDLKDGHMHEISPDYNSVNSSLQKEIENSQDWLKHSIEEK